MAGSRKFLEHLAGNKASEYIHASLKNWVDGQLPLISRDKVVVEDITMISHVRRKVLRDYLPRYSGDLALGIRILQEVDAFTTETDTRSFRILVTIQQELYKQAQQIARMGNWFWDLNEDKITWSDEIFSMYELPPQNEITFDLASFNHPDDAARVKEQMAISRATLQPHDFYYRIILPNGNEKTLHARGRVHANEKGEPYRMLGTLQDVTAQTQTNNELQRKNKELESFTYIASHDLQEPLRKIKFYLSQMKPAEGIAEDYANRTANEATRMQQLINSLLEYSHATTGSRAFEKISLTDIADAVSADLQELLHENHAVLDIQPLPAISGIPSQLHQLFVNLISNAVKYKRQGLAPHINISCEYLAHTKQHKVSFADNGIGFDQKYAESIFDLFRRLHNKQAYPGTGVGLAICKKIAENHNGSISAEGIPDAGAIFHVYLPAVH
jgi:signal transduction histidine kinase